MNHVRHSGIYTWPSHYGATLIGAGGIGAVTAVTLAKMGAQFLTLYDTDVVSEENIPTQLHRTRDLGLEKVFAVSGLVKEFSDECSVTEELKMAGTGVAIRDYFVISAVDSIDARKRIWDALDTDDFTWYLDARMGAEVFSLYTVHYSDRYWYDNALYSVNEEDVPEEPCTSKATFYTANIAAGLIGHTIKQIISGVKPPRRLTMDLNNYVFIGLGG